MDQKYIFYILFTDFIYNQIKGKTTGSTGRRRLDRNVYEKLIIPYPTELIRQEVIFQMDRAIETKFVRESQAELLLSSFDEFVCEKLGFTSQYISTPLIGHRIYKTKNFKTFNSRLDPYYYQTQFDNYYASFEKNSELVSLKELTREIFTGKTPPKENYTEEKSNIIVKAGALKGNEINWSKVAYATNGNLSPGLQDFDILLLSAAHQISYIGKNPSIVLIPNEMKKKAVHFVGELLCIRPDIEKVHPYYLLAILKTKFYYQLINRETRGQTSHLYPDDVSKIKIPIPKDKSVQIEISMELQNRLSEAERLFSLAEEEFAQAKKEIENLILE